MSLDYLIAGKEPEQPTPPLSTTVINNYYGRHYFEYKSKRTLFGLPLVHINCGPGLRWARGIIAVGNVATGLVALGGVSAGLLSLGGVSLGLLLALGGVAAGSIAIGAVAIGLLTLGGVTLGWLSIGGVAKGTFALGGVVAASKVAIGGVASAPVAIGATVEGAQTFLISENGGLTGDQLAAAMAAVRAACAGPPAGSPTCCVSSCATSDRSQFSLPSPLSRTIMGENHGKGDRTHGTDTGRRLAATQAL